MENIRIISLLIFIILSIISITYAVFVDQIIYGQNNATEYYTGNMNLFISVPHDGQIIPNCSNRTNDTLGNYLRDTNTKPISIIIRNRLKQLLSSLNRVPFMNVMNYVRYKVDVNRDPDVAVTVKNGECYEQYLKYHEQLRNFSDVFMRNSNYSKALFIDIHGNAHPEGWIELGYLYTANYLNNRTIITDKTKSSTCNAALATPINDLLRGNLSLGAIIERKFNLTINCVPSPTNPKPNNGNYYDGGFITETYGSKNCSSNVDAIQIELPAIMRNKTTYSSYAETLAQAIYDYYMLHFS